MCFVTDIQLMMHGFGDCRRPLYESAVLIESIVHQQMNSFLQLALEMAEQRGNSIVGAEDILFLMRRDLVKLQRLVNYMALKDLYQKSPSLMAVGISDGTELPFDGEASRKKLCSSFLQSIDQSGEYEPVHSASLHDAVKLERSRRLDLMTQGMSDQKYLEYCKARRSSFCPRLKVTKFREWLLTGDNNKIEMGKHVIEMLNFLALETVAQIVDLCLLVKRDASSHIFDLSRYCTPTKLNPDYPSVLLQQQSGKMQGLDNNLDVKIGMNPITPGEVREVVRRYWRNISPFAPYSVVRSPITSTLLVA